MLDVVFGDIGRVDDIDVALQDYEILQEVARHAEIDHGLTDIPPALVDQVREKIVSVA